MKPFDEAAVDQEIADRLASIRRDMLESEPLRRLALPPEWTRELALECQMASDTNGLEELLVQAQELSLCKVRRERTLTDSDRLRFWVPKRQRASLLEQWRSSGADVSDDLAQISARIVGAPSAVRLRSATGVLRWAELSQAELAARVVTGEALGEMVAAALDEDNPAVAAEWVRAGESLGWLLGGEMELAATRARRRLRRHHQEAQDARYLADFVSRSEQLEEVEELLGPSPQWAVHFLGQSGVGKTMLMRYLTNRIPCEGAEQGSSPCPAARIDFDHIDPRFPLEHPARLLVELADQLAAHVETPTQEVAYLGFEEAVTAYEAARIEGVEPDVLAVLRAKPFGKVISAFADFTKALPSPVILILDTCEELAKLHPAGEEVPSVEAMFEIVEQVHEAGDGVFVVFAGRRWLTPKAANLDRSGGATPPAVMSLKSRPYMNMHPVRGFTQGQATTYLRDMRKLGLDRRMLRAVLAATRDRGKPASVEDRSQDHRYAPSEVVRYSRWIESDPNLRPKDLASGNHDPYVEVRIFKRLESSDVKAAVPAAMLLERFDWDTIEPALRDTSSSRNALTGLIEQEWTHLEGGPDLEQIVISVDRGLLPRLREYFDHAPERKDEVEAARRTLAPHLAQFFDLPSASVRPDQIDAAIRVMDPDEAARLFDRLADRVGRERSWSWGESVCSLLLAPEREPKLPDSLVASVSALYVGVLEQRGATADLDPIRKRILQMAGKHPERRSQLVLAARARLGMVTAGAITDEDTVRVILTRSRLLLGRKESDASVAPALLGAAETLVESYEASRSDIPMDNVRRCLAALARPFDDDATVKAYLLVLEGRLLTAAGSPGEALLAFKRAAATLPNEPYQPGFTDWVAPASVRHRVLLEVLRHRISLGRERLKFLERCETTALEGSESDAGQLLSLVLQARRARGELSRFLVERAMKYEESLEGYELIGSPHSAAPPLFASIAECLLDLGRPREALDLLAAREARATARRTDEGTARAAALATLRILRRYRLRERYGLISSLSSSRDPEIRAEAMAAGALIAGLRPPRGVASAEDHLAWRARVMLDPRDEEMPLVAIRRKHEAPPGRDRWGTTLDRLEAELVRRRWKRRRRGAMTRAIRDATALGYSPGYGPTMQEPFGEAWLRLRVRRAALLENLEEVTVTKGRRRLLARIALEEGELMALRLPGKATALLELAERMMGKGGDSRGAFIACLRGAIARVHAGEEVLAAKASTKVLDRYRDLRKVETELPSVEQLRARSWQKEELPGGAWVEWVWRLELYGRWCEERGTRRRDAVPSFEPETELSPALGAAGIEVRAAVRRGARTTQAAAISFPVVGTVLLVGAILLVAMVVGVSIGGALGLALGSVAAGAVLATLGILVEETIFKSGWLADGYDLSLVLAPTAPEQPPEVEARFTPWSRNRLLRPLVRGMRHVPPRSRWVVNVPLEEAMIDRPLPDALQVAVSRRRRRGRSVPVRLLVTPNLSGFAWERWLLADLDRREGASPDALPAIWRIRSRDLLVLPEGIWPPGVSLRAAPRWRPYMISSAEPGADWLERGSEGPGRVAIALGFPAYTRAGWRLRIDDAELNPLESVTDHPTQELLSPDRLATEAPIAIVMGRPGGDHSPERWTAGGLRAFANETSLAGARAVIAVPSLPAERASEVVRVLTEAILSWDVPPSREELRELHARLRRAVYEGAGGLDEKMRRSRYEQALDVCLFMPQ
ncbi:MAG TPA: hypothetical protein VH299_09565 [Solirubrobacterales bacterium]|nr:hypothetical protein [Solirubrobacterales bacterium]